MFQIVENRFLTKKQLIAMCRSKKRRICKKWVKNLRNYRDIPDDQIYKSGNIIFCHPIMAYNLRKEMEKQSQFRSQFSS